MSKRRCKGTIVERAQDCPDHFVYVHIVEDSGGACQVRLPIRAFDDATKIAPEVAVEVEFDPIRIFVV